MQDLYRILSGTTILNLHGLTLTVRPFSVIDRYQAEEYGQRCYDKAFSEGAYTLEETYELSGWNEELEARLADIPKRIEQMKVDYYNIFFNGVKERTYISKNIDLQNSRYYDLMKQKHSYFDKTCENAKLQSTKIYLFEKSVYKDEILYDYSDISVLNVISKFNEVCLDETEVRKLSKNYKWRTLWNSIKDPSSIFVNHPSTYTDEQLSLIIWTRTYDSVYESPECPDQKIIEDDIALDGWFIIQSRKRNEEQKQKLAEKKGSDAGEIFMPVRSQEDAYSVMALNTGKAQQKIQMLQNDLEKHGSIDDQKLSSVKEEMRKYVK